jgi:hypothetical protein
MADEIGAINFDGVEATADKGFTRPGTIDVFKITKVEFANSSKKGTPGMVVTFENSESSFRHTFYLKASTPDKTKTMLGRIQALLKYVRGENEKLQGNITPAILVAKLKDQELALKVGGEVSSNGKGFATLSFSGFGKMKNELSFLKFTAEEQTKIDEALEAIENSRANTSDQEGSGSSSESEVIPEVESENF